VIQSPIDGRAGAVVTVGDRSRASSQPQGGQSMPMVITEGCRFILMKRCQVILR
jgi:hypothetical protein